MSSGTSTLLLPTSFSTSPLTPVSVFSAHSPSLAQIILSHPLGLSTSGTVKFSG